MKDPALEEHLTDFINDVIDKLYYTKPFCDAYKIKIGSNVGYGCGEFVLEYIRKYCAKRGGVKDVLACTIYTIGPTTVNLMKCYPQEIHRVVGLAQK